MLTVCFPDQARYRAVRRLTGIGANDSSFTPNARATPKRRIRFFNINFMLSEVRQTRVSDLARKLSGAF